MIERVAFEARESEFIYQKSGVSARLTISALENLVSTAELRMLQSKSAQTTARVSDMLGIIPAVAGKVELVYEGNKKDRETLLCTCLEKPYALVFRRFSRTQKPSKERSRKVRTTQS